MPRYKGQKGVEGMIESIDKVLPIMPKLPKVMICSIFRDSEEYLNRYFTQVSNQVDYPPQALKYVFVEGDSKDNTHKRLIKWKGSRSNVTVKKINFGVPSYGSIVHPERFRVRSNSTNAAFEEIDDSIDYVLYLMSDLIIKNGLIRELIHYDKDIVAPFIYTKGIHGGHPVFYDVWAFRKDGKHFSFAHSYVPPYTKNVDLTKPFQIDSAGSVLLIKADIVRAGVRLTEKEEIVGFCKEAKKRGYEIWTVPEVQVLHP